MSSYRFDLEKATAAWRRPLEHNRAISSEDLEELESSFCDRVENLVEAGMQEEAAFQEAVRRMGSYGTADVEYRKVYWGKLKRRRQLRNEFSWRFSMLKNYLKLALRNLLRQKGYSFINIAGLTLGMACCLLLFQYVAYETSFDEFNTKKDRLYRGTLEYSQDGQSPGFTAMVALAFGPTMAQEVPGIVRFARIHPAYGGAVLSYQGASDPRTFTEDRVLFVDTTFFSMFDYPLVKGDRSRVLRQPQTMLVSESMAQKYFGEDEPIGKTLDLTWWESGTYTVAGVLEDVPSTSHLQFDFLIPLDGLLDKERFREEGAAWGAEQFVTYLELDENVNSAALEHQITETYRTIHQSFLASRKLDIKSHLQPLSDVHLNGEIWAPATRTGDRKLVYFFTLIGLITLVIALVNYVNLATGRAMDRAREVGVRKVVGAYRKQLMSQFLLESALTNILALVLAIMLSMLLLPVVNRVAAVEMSRDLWLDGRFWAVFLGLFGLGALLSGLYPAFILSSFKPAAVLKGKAGAFASRVALRKVLVVVQFAASIALLAGTTIVYSQLTYMRGLDTGLDLEQVLVVEGPRVRSDGSNRVVEMSALKNELRKIPAVQKIGLSFTTPGQGFADYARMHRVTADPSTGSPVRGTNIDADFPDVYGLDLVVGQPFYEGMTIPDSGDVPIIVNETLVQRLGFSSNEEAVSERITMGRHVYIVRGVYRDFQWSSAHQEREAVLFQFEPGGGSISMKVSTQELPATIAAVEQVFKSLFPGNPFHYNFADAAFDEQYKADRRFATLFAGFAGIAIIIACLGLFGLVSFTAAQRTKEIGVRKVLGASVSSIVALLSLDFLKLVGLAFVIATPLAYVGLQRWLESFAYRIEIGPGVFVLTGALVLLIALATLSYQSIRAALADPVKSLRYE